MSALEIRLLGRPEIRVNGAPLEGLPAKLEAVVYYLAISPRSVPRSTLAGLLWSDRSEQDARMNLRAALAKVPAALEPHLVVTREWLALDRNREMDVDVQRFDHALGALSAAADGPAKRLERLAAVAALYRDDFLAGFASGHAPEFDAWCTAERSRLRHGAVKLMGEVLRLRREGGNDADVADDARRILQLSPGHDVALRELMEALARAGQRNAAIEEYERHRRLWREELGIAPSEQTVRLAERIVAGEAPGEVAQQPASAPLQLIGRERDCALVTRLLAEDEGRIVTITGLGGIGKTRLAQAVMAEVKPRFAGGAMLFSAGAMRSGAALGPAMVAAFGLQMQGRNAPLKYLQDYLREKSMLLVLDSFESILRTEAVDLLVAIAQSSPGVRFLVTSREALGVAEEAIVAIEGLAYPRAADTAWRESPAVQLFIQRATRGYVQFDPERERAGIVRICERVEGVPLALELAAAMARTLPCVEIARAIERDLGALAREDAGLSPRHRSVVGVLTCAFGQMPAELQAAAAGLSAFHGPFTADAAERVAGVSLRQLSTLMEKSWLRRDPRAGYSMHDMVRQFTAGQRAAAGLDASDLAKRHGSFFLEMLEARREPMLAGDDPVALDEVGAIMRDVIEAVEWGAAHAPDAALDRGLEILFRYYENRGDFVTARATFEGLVARLERRKGARRSLARAMACQGWALVQLAQLDGCKPVLERAIELARAAGDMRISSEALRGIALAQVLEGKPAEVGTMLDECIALAREAGDAYLEVAALVLMGVAVSYVGTGRGQHDYYQRAIEIAREKGYRRAVMIASFNLGDAHQAAGEMVEAERCFRECLALGESAGNRRHVVMSLANLAAIALDRGDAPESRRLVDQAWSIAREVGERRAFSFLSQAYAELCLVEGEVESALEWADRMLATADEISWGWSAAFAVALRGEALCRLGRRDEALQALLDLHRRSKDTDFGVHHGSFAVEASRWIFAFSTHAGARERAAGALHALAGPLVIDEWVAKRAKDLARLLELPAPGPFAGTGRELMDAMLAELPPGTHR